MILSCLDVIPSEESPPICKTPSEQLMFPLRCTLGLNPYYFSTRKAVVLRAICSDLDGDEVIQLFKPDLVPPSGPEIRPESEFLPAMARLFLATVGPFWGATTCIDISMM